MRISPLAIYGVFLDLNVLTDMAIQNCKLTNPNPICLDAVKIYVSSLWIAMRTGDRAKAYQIALKNTSTDTIRRHLLDAQNYPEPCLVRKQKVNTDSKFKGYLGIALQNAYHELLYGKSFESSILNILKRGGDTDTNACIAGALLGSIYGKKSMPADWIETIDQNNGGLRQTFYPWSCTNDLTEIAKGLIKLSRQYSK
jgi:ADP-ribosylglycohydrolase